MEPTHADAWLGVGIVLDYQNRITESIHYIKKAIEINPSVPEYWYVFAEVQHKLGFMEEAASAYQRVIELGYKEFDIWIDYSKLLYEAGYYSECEKVLLEAIQRFPDVPELFYRICSVLIEMGKKQEALIFLENALELDYDKHIELLEHMPVLVHDETVMHLINTYKNK
jgi:tetratricopeptide (TPR) repeat protein